MKNYELMTIFKPNLDAEEVDKLIEKIDSIIADFGGKVESTDKVGRKKLAYEIAGFVDGFIVNQVVSVPADKIVELKRFLVEDSYYYVNNPQKGKKYCDYIKEINDGVIYKVIENM